MGEGREHRGESWWRELCGGQQGFTRGANRGPEGWPGGTGRYLVEHVEEEEVRLDRGLDQGLQRGLGTGGRYLVELHVLGVAVVVQ